MEVVSNNYMPGDPRLIQQLVYELKSQGIFDQFRKECIADVDTKPAYQNLRQRVEGSVTSFLRQQIWRPDMNKNQVREQLRKSIYESGYLETGVERIVDQVVNPKINTVFLPQVEDVVYRYLGIEKPNRLEVKKEIKIDVTDLLPTDLEAVSPESDHIKDDTSNLNDSINLDTKLEEDESPPFEPLDVQPNYVQQEENSIDSHLSGFSGLQSHDSNPPNEIKLGQMELSNQDSQVSRHSSESHLSIVTSEDNMKMEICEDSDSKLLKSSDSDSKIDVPNETYSNSDKDLPQKEMEEAQKIEKTETDKKDDKSLNDKIEKKSEDEKVEKKHGDKKHSEKRSDEKKHRSSEKSHSKDKKDDKHRKSSSSSRDKDKEKSKHSSSSKDKDKTKDRKESKSSSSNNKDKSERDKSDKERYNKEKDRSDKEKDKSKSSNSKSSSSSSSKHSTKDKDKNSSSNKKESSSKDKEKTRPSSSSSSKDSKSKSSHSESKSKSSSDKHKKEDKNSHNGKHSSSSSIKKDRDKKRDPKKDSKDDHYSSKEKKNERRSTDRDSNDGQAGKQSQANYSIPGSSSSHTQKNSQESSNSNSGSGSGDSGTSDQIEQTIVKSPIKSPETTEIKEVVISCVDIQKFKYQKPKFASNFQEARKIMKIRKRLAKLERQNQLSLAQIEVPSEVPVVNGISHTENVTIIDKVDDLIKKPITPERKENPSSSKDITPVLQSTELSKESWEALEARLAQEMSNINYNSYESPYDDYDYSGYNSIVISPRKNNQVSHARNIVIEEKIENIMECSKSCKLSDDKGTEASLKVANETVEKTNETGIEAAKIIVDNKTMLPPQVHDNSKHLVQISSQGTNETKERYMIVELEKLTEANGVMHVIKKEHKNVTSDSHVTQTDHDIIEENPKKVENVCDSDGLCRYLEKPSASFERNLQFLYKYVAKLQQEVEHSVKASQNNFLPLRRVRCKRKLEENVDLKNNNKAHYEQTIETKKRRRSVAPNPNSLISRANKEKMCNSTDISANDSFSLPLSPAESDKSNDKKEEESTKLVKQKRLNVARNTSTRSQRYSSDDLYKPRPLFASSRRSRGANNPGN